MAHRATPFLPFIFGGLISAGVRDFRVEFTADHGRGLDGVGPSEN